MNILSTRIKSALEKSFLPETRKSFTFYPSSASVELSHKVNGKTVSGGCLRQQFYKYTGERPSNQPTVDIKVSSTIGDYITLMVKDFLDNYGFLCNLQRVAAEHPFYIPEINTSGRCDFIAYDNANKEFIGIEIKSVGEYKANKVISKPAEEHVLQSLLYLHYYKNIDKSLNIKKWYIVYISRAENYSIKGKKHGSDITMIWDFYVTMDEASQAAIIHSSSGTEKWEDYNIPNIYNRYKRLKDHINLNTIPDKDYKLYYNEEDIVDMYKKNELTRKMDIEKVEKWLKKGAPSGKLNVLLGDIECSFCPFRGKCWPGEFKDEEPIETDLTKLTSTNNTNTNNDTLSKDWI